VNLCPDGVRYQRLLILLSALIAAACAGATPGEDQALVADLDLARTRMVREQLRARDITDDRVLTAMGRVPRHEFVPPSLQARAYTDRPLPIGRGQTISQPYVVALMTQLLELRADERVLEVGTGSGYQAAILSELCHEVYTVEIDSELAADAARVLQRLGYQNVHVRSGDGFYGWPEEAPFDAVIITAAAPRIPERLVDQLREGGRLTMPLGAGMSQQLVLGIKRAGRLSLQQAGGVLFVPMTGAIRDPTQSPAPTGLPASPDSGGSATEPSTR